MRRKYHLNSRLWPNFAINGDNVDGLSADQAGNIPSTRLGGYARRRL